MRAQKVAITGGIGSGKSTVSAMIEKMGYAVFDADKIYDELLRNEEIVRELCSLINVAPVVDKEGNIALDKSAVSKKVFKDKGLLEKLNLKTHGLVYDRIDEISQKNSNEPYLFFEIPLLFESGREDDFDKVIVVLRKKEDRIKSVCKRSSLSPEQVLERMENQIDYDNLPIGKHTLIYNDGDLDQLYFKVREIIEGLR